MNSLIIQHTASDAAYMVNHEINLMLINCKTSASLIEHAINLIQQVHQGKKSPIILKTALESLESAKRQLPSKIEDLELFDIDKLPF